MKLVFSRQSTHRDTKAYEYECKPEHYVRGTSKRREGWNEDGFTFVEIKSLLNLGSEFRLALWSEPGELESWLERYASEKPREAIPMLLKMLLLAVKQAELGGVPE